MLDSERSFCGQRGSPLSKCTCNLEALGNDVGVTKSSHMLGYQLAILTEDLPWNWMSCGGSLQPICFFPSVQRIPHTAVIQ